MVVAVSRTCLEGNGGPPCTLAHGLPWYFTAVLVAVWIVVLVAAAALLRYRVRLWLARRRAHRTPSRAPALDEAHGTGVELY